MTGRQLTPSEQVLIVRGLGRIGEREKADSFMAGYFFFVDDDDEANWLRSLMATNAGGAIDTDPTSLTYDDPRTFVPSPTFVPLRREDPRRLRCDKCGDVSVLFGPVGMGEEHDKCGGTYRLVNTRAES
jgi:hypothetical protein